jgi:hypothetical protein
MIQRFRQIFRINAVEMLATSSTLQMEKGGYRSADDAIKAKQNSLKANNESKKRNDK